jgi:hypothetical protein
LLNREFAAKATMARAVNAAVRPVVAPVIVRRLPSLSR